MYLQNTPKEQDVTQGQFFWQSLSGLNLELSFSKAGRHNKVKELSLPYFLDITR